MRNILTSGEIQRMFLEDENTIIRRPNIRKFCLDNDIFMEIHEKAWLIDYQTFMKKINPQKIKKHYKLPKMRSIHQCVKLWNKTHRYMGQMIDKHMIERFFNDERVFAYHHGNRWVINYNQLEPLIAEFIEKNNYKIRRIKR